MSDTTTTLFPGSGGDVMDEEQITQAGDGVTQAKRPRVVVSGRTGASIVDPVASEPAANPFSIPALAMLVVSDNRPTGYIDGELRPASLTSDGRLRVSTSAATSYMDMFGDTGPIETDPSDLSFCPSNHPYGI